jgi:hypothetical protein
MVQREESFMIGKQFSWIPRIWHKQLFVTTLLTVIFVQSGIAALSVSGEYIVAPSLALRVMIRNASADVYYENIVLSLKTGSEDVYVERIGAGETVIKEVPVIEHTRSYYATLRYTYCEGAACFYREEEILIRVSTLPGWIRVLAEVLLIGVLAIIVVVFRKKVKTGFLVALAVVVIFAWLGIRNWQPETVRSIASTLCVSCIGMETVPPAFSVSNDEIEAIWGYPSVSIEVFHTEWCKSCPIVIEYLKELALYTGNITLSLFDAEKDSDLARQKGIYSGNSLVVPTTIVEGKSRIIGAERFPERLIEAVKEAKR